LFDNVIITCHNASNTKEATISVNNEILEILESII
jgi:phosphoglycerate dehydrogenase-like enzyme